MADSHIKFKKYTIEEDNVIKEYYPKLGYEGVKKYLPHRNKQSIQNRVNKLGVKYLTYNKYYFDNIDTEDKAYWLGFIYADGYTTNDNRFGIELSSVDHSHIEKLNKSMESNINIRTRTRFLNNKELKSSSIMIKNKHLVDSMINKGIVPNKTEILNFPNEKIIPEELMSHFIRGFFDGDGCFSYKVNDRIRKDRKNKIYQIKNCEISLVCKSYVFIEALKNYLNDKLEENLVIKENRSLYYIRMSNKKNINKFINYCYDKPKTYLDRKYENINKLKEYCNGHEVND